MDEAFFLNREQLEAGLDRIRQSPRNAGAVELIVRRPKPRERETLLEATLDLRAGLVGDDWSQLESRMTPDGSPHPDTQITVTNARVIALLAQSKDRWPLAGDQLYVDLDLSLDNLPAGTRLAIGAAVIEVTSPPHNGCKLFTQRYGVEATRFVNSPEGKALRLRGLNARVIQAGVVRVGDLARKVSER